MGGKPRAGANMVQMGVDVSRGGKDQTVLTPCYGIYFDSQLVYPGKMIDDGDRVVQLVVQATPRNTVIVVDVIGVGASPFDGLKRVRRAYAMNGAEASSARDRTGRLSFFNKRAEWHWKVREMLDPANPEDQQVAIPDDPELLADLTAPTWELTRTGIKIEPKEEIAARLGRSPDKGESLIYSAVLQYGGDLRTGVVVALGSSVNDSNDTPWSRHGGAAVSDEGGIIISSAGSYDS